MLPDSKKATNLYIHNSRSIRAPSLQFLHGAANNSLMKDYIYIVVSSSFLENICMPFILANWYFRKVQVVVLTACGNRCKDAQVSLT